MKKAIYLAALTVLYVGLNAPVLAAEAPAVKAGYDTYTCDALTGIRVEDVGPIIYYVAGHYDARHDIWTDYGPGSKTSTAEEYTVRLPVENIYAYCTEHPKETVANAIMKSKKVEKPAKAVAPVKK